MKLPFIVHSIYLVSAIFITFFWVQNPALSGYTLQLVGFFVLLYMGSHFWRQQQKRKTPFILSAVDSFIFMLIILLLVLSTGGLSSPLFFLLYFLLFSFSLLWEPAITFVFTAALIVFFLYTYPELDSHQLASLSSLILITPLSLFFGQQYMQVLEQKGMIKILSNQFKRAEKDIEAEETDTLIWLSINFRTGMQKIIDRISQVLANPNLSHSQKKDLNEALEEGKKLLKTGTLLKEKVDKQTDEKKEN